MSSALISLATAYVGAYSPSTTPLQGVSILNDSILVTSSPASFLVLQEVVYQLIAFLTCAKSFGSQIVAFLQIPVTALFSSVSVSALPVQLIPVIKARY